jgi:TM2 domain-containing membrane protein YozV
MQRFKDTSSRYCLHCGYSNPTGYTNCGYYNQENPVKPSLVIEPPPPQPPGRILIVTKPKSRTIYIILGLLFGWLGLHNIYAKRNNVGAVQLGFFFMFFWTIIVPFGLVVWSIIEVIRVKVDGNGIPMS